MVLVLGPGTEFLALDLGEVLVTEQGKVKGQRLSYYGFPRALARYVYAEEAAPVGGLLARGAGSTAQRTPGGS